jgi:nucleotide-binding universal stress UspA family protein
MTIYVGIDGSKGAAEAARWAVAEGEVRATPVVAIVAWDLLAQRSADDDTRFDAKYDERDALTALDGWLIEALGTEAAATVGRVAVNDLPWRALVTAATKGELLVVGARGNGGFLGLRLGSVSEKCLHYAKCPVVILHEGAAGAGPSGTIVVGVDGSDAAARALAWALDEARIRKLTVRALTAWDGGALGWSAYPGAMDDPTVFEQAAKDVLSKAVDSADTSGVTVQRHLADGGPAGAILDSAKDASLVVVGSRGMGGLKSALMGSVSRQVAHHAPCPVVVVPDPEVEQPT